jgi:serine phosphatase RsbU (regulator of sigma subunit)/anti-sigma regulatory factor (Ser/Thr protein kinase)
MRVSLNRLFNPAMFAPGPLKSLNLATFAAMLPWFLVFFIMLLFILVLVGHHCDLCLTAGAMGLAVTALYPWVLRKRLDGKLRNALLEKNQYIRMIDRDLEFARKVQLHLLPQAIPEFETLDIAAKYVPAMKVGGDFYDVIALDYRHVAFLISDASGHGIAAALVTAMGRSSFIHHLQQCQSPAQVLSRVNEHVRASIPEGFFITACLMIVDIETNICRFSNAGHVPPLLYHSGARGCELLKSGGPPLGFLNTFIYEERSFEIQEEDRILFYTDGLAEPGYERTAGFGTETLKGILSESVKSRSQEVADWILRQYVTSIPTQEPANDDVCLMVVSVTRSDFAKRVAALLPQQERATILNYHRLYKETEINMLCAIILSKMDRSGYRDSTIRQMRAVIVELVRNAIVHGNGGDEKKWVKVAYHIDNRRVIAGIHDEGAGFDPSRIGYIGGAMPLPSENEKGLLQVRRFADQLLFTQKGNCIVLIKNRV